MRRSRWRRPRRRRRRRCCSARWTAHGYRWSEPGDVRPLSKLPLAADTDVGDTSRTHQPPTPTEVTSHPKIATVVGADLDAFCQLRPGDLVRFVPVTPAEAILIARTRAAAFEKFLDNELLSARRLAQRLAETDLIGDVGTD